MRIHSPSFVEFLSDHIDCCCKELKDPDLFPIQTAFKPVADEEISTLQACPMFLWFTPAVLPDVYRFVKETNRSDIKEFTLNVDDRGVNVVEQVIDRHNTFDGHYTYVVVVTGDGFVVRMARCWNMTEFATKHVVLAEGSLVVAAGEMEIVTDDTSIFNDRSGTYHEMISGLFDANFHDVDILNRDEYDTDITELVRACFEEGASVDRVDYELPVPLRLKFGPVVELLVNWTDQLPDREISSARPEEDLDLAFVRGAIRDFDCVRLISGPPRTYVVAYQTLQGLLRRDWKQYVNFDKLREIHAEFVATAVDIGHNRVPDAYRQPSNYPAIELSDIFDFSGKELSCRVMSTRGHCERGAIRPGALLGQGNYSMTYACDHRVGGEQFGAVKINMSEFLEGATEAIGKHFNSFGFGTCGLHHEWLLSKGGLEYPVAFGDACVPSIMLMPLMTRTIDAVRSLGDIIEGLIFMHRNGIVHGDVKPDNIMYYATLNRHVLIDCGGCYRSTRGVQKGGTPLYAATGIVALATGAQCGDGRMDDLVSWCINAMEAEHPRLWSQYTVAFEDTAAHKLQWLRRLCESATESHLGPQVRLILNHAFTRGGLKLKELEDRLLRTASESARRP